MKSQTAANKKTVTVETKRTQRKTNTGKAPR